MPQSYSITDVGRRRDMNQDYIFASDAPLGNFPCLYLVADGMGGHKAGELASEIAVETIVNHIEKAPHGEPARLFDNAYHLANTAVRGKAATKPEYQGMGTTMVGCTIDGDKLYAANVGDSRLYVMDDHLRQITVDHSLVEAMVRAGSLQRSQMRTHPERNVITRAIGAEDSLSTDIFEVTLKENSLVLLCSDGLTVMLEDKEIEDILRRDLSLEEKADLLVERANEEGGKDNISVVLVQTSRMGGRI